MASAHPVNGFLRLLQGAFAACAGGLGGYSLYAYFEMPGLISDGGIIPLIGCGISCLAAFWGLLAVCSANPYFHFGVAKLFLGGLIVTAWGSNIVANWMCSNDFGELNHGCDPASIAPPGWMAGIVTAAFDGAECIFFVITCIICARHRRTRPQAHTPNDRLRAFGSGLRDQIFRQSVGNLERGMSHMGDQVQHVEADMINGMRRWV